MPKQPRKTAPPAPLRATILVGHFLEEPLPEAVEMSTRAVHDFQTSALNIELRVDAASEEGIRRAADAVCDLLIYYGHGTEDGRLTFGGRPTAFADLPHVRGFWGKLHACLIFACYGDRFARRLPCPWLAFSTPILKLAPKGYLHELILALQSLGLRDAAEKARRRCEAEMTSNFADVMQLGPRPLPDLKVLAGTPSLRRLSPGLGDRTRVEFESIGEGDQSYPDHDPFVGRVDDLRSLLRLPSPSGDGELQRIVWVHGDAGMGKSALLRQLAMHVRDLAFHEVEEPVYLAHMHCYKFTKPEEVEKRLCEVAADLNGLPAPSPTSIDALFRALSQRPGVQVWILDDLTYLDILPDSQDRGSRMLETIRLAAKARAVPLQLVASARRRPTTILERVHVPALGDQEAIDLAMRMTAAAGACPPSDGAPIALGAQRLLAHARGCTVLYKRSLRLALDFNQSFLDYAADIEKEGSLAHLDESEFNRRMVRRQVDQLHVMEAEHGFAYAAFLGVLSALITKASYFSKEELDKWFRGRFVVGGKRRREPILYERGLTYLVRLGFLAVERRDGEVVFTLPPNQRSWMKDLADAATRVPKSVPLRGVRERLSLALERAGRGDLSALTDFLAMRSDYLPHVREPEAAQAVMCSYGVEAELLVEADPSNAVILLEKAWRVYEKASPRWEDTEFEAASEAAISLINKGVALGKLNQPAEAVKAYDEVVSRFGERPEAALAEQVANALVRMGVTLGNLNQPVEEVKAYDEVVRRFGERSEAAVAEHVAEALFNRGVVLGKLNQPGEEVKAYDEVVSRFGERPEAALAEQVAMALVNKGVALRQFNQPAEEVKAYDEVVRRFSERSEAALAEHVARALFNKGVVLGRLNQPAEAVKAYDEVVRRFGERPEAALAEQVAEALVNKGSTLGQLNQPAEAVKDFDDVVRRFGARPEAALATQVAMALVNKGIALGELKQPGEVVKACDEVVRRFEERPEAALAEQVAKALVNKGFTLGELKQPVEEVKAYDEVVRRFGERPEADVAEQVAAALFSKGVVLGKLNQPAEEVKAYDEVVRRFGERSEAALAEPVAKALVNKGITLGELNQPGEGVKAYDEVVRRFGERPEADLAEQVAKALVEMSAAMAQMGQLAAAVAAVDNLVARYGTRAEDALKKCVALATQLKCKILRLRATADAAEGSPKERRKARREAPARQSREPGAKGNRPQRSPSTGRSPRRRGKRAP
ncbi:MAG: AAA family ATPase [Planctomycetes bacterium]|nr:AAA family ATPase [Planctomycetota bacterium]